MLTDIPENLSRLGEEEELVVFRILQESLNNVHRHSGSKVATVRIGSDSRQVWLEVRDKGKGISGFFQDELRAGVGISGMRERIRDVSGALELRSDGRGTLVKAVIPLRAAPHRTDRDQSKQPQHRVN